MSSPDACPAHAWALTSPPADEACDVTVAALWTDYLALGGSMPLETFHGCLDAVVHVDDAEHDLVALALNEHLLDHGHRFPVPYLRDRPSGGTDRVARLPQRCRVRHRAG